MLCPCVGAVNVITGSVFSVPRSPAEDHAHADVVHLEGGLGGHEVAVEQLGERDGLEEQHVSLEGSEVDASPNVECRDVSAAARKV
jgi:hypothetical protein